MNNKPIKLRSIKLYQAVRICNKHETFISVDNPMFKNISLLLIGNRVIICDNEEKTRTAYNKKYKGKEWKIVFTTNIAYAEPLDPASLPEDSEADIKAREEADVKQLAEEKKAAEIKADEEKKEKERVAREASEHEARQTALATQDAKRLLNLKKKEEDEETRKLKP